MDNAGQACAERAVELYPRVKGTVAAANVAAVGLSCAAGLENTEPKRGTLLDKLEKATRETFDNPKIVLSDDDRSGLYMALIEAKEAVDRNELQARRAVSQGLSFRDYRAIMENVPGIDSATPRKRFKPQKLLPKTTQEQPTLIGVSPDYLRINSLKIVEGRFFDESDNTESTPVCVLGESAKVNLLGYDPAVGKWVKVNDTWLQVIGVLSQQATADT
jgi:putative ABC transport system permease protein